MLTVEAEAEREHTPHARVQLVERSRELPAPRLLRRLVVRCQRVDVLDQVAVQALAVALQALGERERQVLVLRYGLVDEEPKTLEEIGKRLGLTRERVRQIELDSLRRLANLREMQQVAT